MVEDLGTGFGLAAWEFLPLAGEDVDLGHGVDEDDGEDGDGEAKEEGAREVPDDTPAQPGLTKQQN